MKASICSIAISTVIAFSSLGMSAVAHARQDMNMANHQGMHTHTAAQEAMSDGEIKKVDKEAGKLTIKHGELKNVGMAAMTMAFKVKDSAMLDKVKEGDKVHFAVEKIGGSFTVTAIEVVK